MCISTSYIMCLSKYYLIIIYLKANRNHYGRKNVHKKEIYLHILNYVLEGHKIRQNTLCVRMCKKYSVLILH